MQFTAMLIIAGLFLTPAFGAPLFLVIPNAETNVVGNDTSGSLAGGPQDIEFELDYGRGQFTSVPGSLLITQFAFRASPGTGAIDLTDTSASVFMSTSPFAPNTVGGNTLITSTFANNFGADKTLVLSKGSGTLTTSPGCTGPGPCPFDMIFMLSTPFLYNPADGSLLLDFQLRGLSGVGNGAFDVESFSAPGGSVATVDGTLGSSTGNVGFGGNILQIGYTLATPEPASSALLFSGLGLLMTISRRRGVSR